MKASDFNNLILPVQQKIFRLARRLLVSTDSAKDATQEVMIKLWNKRGDFGEIKNIEAFAMTMTKNHCLDQLRLKSSQNLRLVHTNYDNNRANPQEELEAKQELSRVEAMMKDLPKAQQMVIHLREIEGYEYDKICEIMDMKPTAVRVALSRGRKTLVEQLSKFKENERRRQN
jgi:RNA polymerase sigma-70 factor (ECF subfamily)